MKRRPSRQVCLKKYVGRCLLCADETRYEVLEVHRVVPGEAGGVYRSGNMVVLCSNHHALVTAGVIQIVRLCNSSAARQFAQVIDEAGTERWVPVERAIERDIESSAAPSQPTPTTPEAPP